MFLKVVQIKFLPTILNSLFYAEFKVFQINWMSFSIFSNKKFQINGTNANLIELNYTKKVIQHIVTRKIICSSMVYFKKCQFNYFLVCYYTHIYYKLNQKQYSSFLFVEQTLNILLATKFQYATQAVYKYSHAPGYAPGSSC